MQYQKRCWDGMHKTREVFLPWFVIKRREIQFCASRPGWTPNRKVDRIRAALCVIKCGGDVFWSVFTYTRNCGHVAQAKEQNWFVLLFRCIFLYLCAVFVPLHFRIRFLTGWPKTAIARTKLTLEHCEKISWSYHSTLTSCWQKQYAWWGSLFHFPLSESNPQLF